MLSEPDGYLKHGQFINILGAILPGPDFKAPLERFEAHIDCYNFDEARELVPKLPVC